LTVEHLVRMLAPQRSVRMARIPIRVLAEEMNYDLDVLVEEGAKLGLDLDETSEVADRTARRIWCEVGALEDSDFPKHLCTVTPTRRKTRAEPPPISILATEPTKLVFPSKRLRNPDTARDDFFREIDRRAPEVRKQLRDDVRPVFTQMLNDLEAAGRLRSHKDDPRIRLDIPGGPGVITFRRTLSSHATASVHESFMPWYRETGVSEPLAEPLRDALDAWMGHFFLTSSWVESVALRTLLE